MDVPTLLNNLIEEVVFSARESEFVDQKSGVSTRLGISAYECLLAAAELRTIKNGDARTTARISDLMAIVPAITGKVELVYEGEQEGAVQVAHNLIRLAIRKEFIKQFPNPERLKRKEAESPYQPIIDWFSNNKFDLENNSSNDEYKSKLLSIKPLVSLVDKTLGKLDEPERLLMCEFILHALAEYSLISKTNYRGLLKFNDMLNAMLN